MADISQLEAALVKADAAGDTPAAKIFADEIRRLRSFKDIKNEGQVEKPPTPFRSSGERMPSDAEMIAGNPIVRGLYGAIEPALGAVQKVANVVGQGDTLNQAMAANEQTIQKAREALGSTGFDAFRFGGNVASPVYMAGGSLLPATATAAGRIGQGALVGGLAGAAAPIYDPNAVGTQTLQNTILGGVGGALVPSAWELAKFGGRGIRNVVQPYLGQPGADASAGRLANQVAGDKSEEIISAMRGAQAIVPGSVPTAGQASVPVNSAEFAALQKIASERTPSTYYGPGGVEGQQNAARLAAVRKIGKTPQDLVAAEQARNALAKISYGKAFAENIKADPALLTIAKNPFFKDAIPDAIRLAEANGINPKTDLTQFLHYIKISLDKMVSRTGDNALANTERRAVADVKDQVIQWLRQKNPAYDAARAEFAAGSIPINQMEVGQELEKRLTQPLMEEGKQRAGVFAQALREAPQMVKKATGEPRELTRFMRPEQLEALRQVQTDLARNATYEGLAAKGSPATRELIGKTVPELQPTGFFSPVVSFSRGAYNRVAGKATDKILTDLAKNMQNPQKLADLMEKAKPFERSIILDELMRIQAVVPSANKEQ